MVTRILVGDCRDVLPTLPAGLVHSCVTSPPYFGLRDYSVEGQIGLEASLDAYITTLVEVFREVRRVLRDDGTCWLNLGDSYNSGTQFNQNRSNGLNSTPYGEATGNGWGGHRPMVAGLKPKDLMMVPARVALALQADGWYLRSDIIWAKKAPMPESVTDRPSSAHEHVFLLTKKARYFYDAEAVKEQALQPFGEKRLTAQHKADAGGFTTNGHRNSSLGTNQGDASRNLRNVWHLGPAPYAEAHFATFPPALVAPCIKAGTSEKGCCAACGAPWVRVIDRENPRLSDEYQAMPHVPKMAQPLNGRNDFGGKTGLSKPGWREHGMAITETLGWHPSCSCAAESIPCTVLDPFAGSGTTGLVADRLGRDSILIELNPAYAKMTHDRIYWDAPLFTRVLL